MLTVLPLVLTFALTAGPPGAAAKPQEEERVLRQIREFENALATATKLALLQAQRDARPGDFSWDPPEVDGFRLPSPQGDIIFVVCVPTLQTDTRSRAQAVAPDDLRRLLLDQLIETMLSSGRGLELEPPAWLTVIAMPDRLGRTPGPYSSKLYLAIAGSDLLRLQRGELSLDAARRTVRIVRTPAAFR